MKQISKKLKMLEQKAPLGKKLIGNPFWSIRIGKHRLIYKIEGKTIYIVDILQRKNKYREV